MLKTVKVLALLICLSGCAAPAPSAFALIPATGQNERFQVIEYALVEQSIDSPTHSGFQERVIEAVNGRQSGRLFQSSEPLIAAPNQALAPFGFRLAANPSPPFSGYALYQGDTLVQRDIAHIWPVSLKDTRGSQADFLLAFETLSGERLYASLNGIQPWPGDRVTSAVPPVYLGNRIAYAQVESDAVSVLSGSEVLYAGSAGAAPRNLTTWGDHWALELDGQVIVDGQNLNQAQGYDKVFHWQEIDSQPFYFFVKNSIFYLSYAGHNLPYHYDLVVHDNTGELAMFNPGRADNVVWFYALRDGLWFYVEVGSVYEQER